MSDTPRKVERSDADLQAQIDALLEAIPPGGSGVAAPAGLRGAPTLVPPVATTAEADLLGADLAKQIQDLLDDAAAQVAPAHEPAPPAATAPPDRGARDATARPAGLESPPPGDVHVPAASAAATDQAQAVAALDAALAQGADDAIAGEFETVSDVMASDGHAAPTVPLEAAAPADLSDLQHVEPVVPDGCAAADPHAGSPLPSARSEAPEPKPQHREAALSTAAGGHGPDEDEGPAAPSTADGPAHGTAAPAMAAPPPHALRERLRRAEAAVLRVCSAVNRPIARRPDLRQALAIAALVTVLNAALVWGWYVVARLTSNGAAPPTASAPVEHSAAGSDQSAAP